MSAKVYDILVIGGGINGCGITRDAAGRGYSVLLAEMDDLASGTSSASTKLIHGGLRYLEQYEFRLVREALTEREILWAMAPHVIWPLRVILPHHAGLRPKWVLRAGLFLYDYIGGRRKLPVTKTLNLRRDPAGKPLRAEFTTGFEYSDCWADDARLVVLNARDAADRGADIRVHTKIVSARRKGDVWLADAVDLDTGVTETIEARMLINAAGPWVDKTMTSIAGHEKSHNVRLVKGSHIVVEKLFDDPRCYIFQNADGRVIFAIPYEDAFTLVGTTDKDYDGDPHDVSISSEEISYLCEAASEYFTKPVERSQVVWAYSGVRPLYDDGASAAQETTREYVLRREGGSGEAPLLNIFGGKLTTYRRLAEEALEIVGEAIGEKGAAWTAGSALPGGDFAMDGFETELSRLQDEYPFLSPAQARRLLRHYGTLARTILGDAKSNRDLGEDFGAGLTAREVDYLMDREWAHSAEDILWRRSKLGLHLSARDIKALEAFVEGWTPGGNE